MLIKLIGGRQRAVIEKDAQGDNIAIIKTEDRLRLVSLSVDYVKNMARAVFYRGIITANGTFEITLAQPYVIDIEDTHDKKLFTELTTKVKGQSRWEGDFRMKDVEKLIEKHGLVSDISLVEEQ